MKNATCSFEKVIEVIKEINNLHLFISSRLNASMNYNLKNSISSVVVDGTIDKDFQTLITNYKSALNRNIIVISEIQNHFPEIRLRIKQAESINEKLLYYMGNDVTNGKVPINKCLNDFLGFRILIDDNLENLLKILDENKSMLKISRLYLRVEGEYRGLHLYFKNGNNKYFPWELQIWHKDHLTINENSHKEHKQKRKYITVPQEYFEANLEERGDD
ncbi:hypothetical protein MX000_05320 [Streptococcus uberis]|uniref:hypothetical protein n=1 Tax=Streptococcus uberis TaxID=1349 RepID=UPI0027DC0E99|nr:hypothetical protein [Streptococcus uberis]MCK1158315.1 hypothetical protein [Streptococcus uberis]MCK1224184.1 hypothetical protein [Streptococcus uberis]